MNPLFFRFSHLFNNYSKKKLNIKGKDTLIYNDNNYYKKKKNTKATHWRFKLKERENFI